MWHETHNPDVVNGYVKRRDRGNEAVLSIHSALEFVGCTGNVPVYLLG